MRRCEDFEPVHTSPQLRTGFYCGSSSDPRRSLFTLLRLSSITHLVHSVPDGVYQSESTPTLTPLGLQHTVETHWKGPERGSNVLSFRPECLDLVKYLPTPKNFVYISSVPCIL